MADNKNVRVFRIIEYYGPRDKVEQQVKASLHGTKLANSVRITATTLGEFPDEVAEPLANGVYPQFLKKEVNEPVR